MKKIFILLFLLPLWLQVQAQTNPDSTVEGQLEHLFSGYAVMRSICAAFYEFPASQSPDWQLPARTPRKKSTNQLRAEILALFTGYAEANSGLSFSAKTVAF